jgi:hypothetical protein
MTAFPICELWLRLPTGHNANSSRAPHPETGPQNARRCRDRFEHCRRSGNRWRSFPEQFGIDDQTGTGALRCMDETCEGAESSATLEAVTDGSGV